MRTSVDILSCICISIATSFAFTFSLTRKRSIIAIIITNISTLTGYYIIKYVIDKHEVRNYAPLFLCILETLSACFTFLCALGHRLHEHPLLGKLKDWRMRCLGLLGIVLLCLAPTTLHHPGEDIPIIVHTVVLTGLAAIGNFFLRTWQARYLTSLAVLSAGSLSVMLFGSLSLTHALPFFSGAVLRVLEQARHKTPDQEKDKEALLTT